MPATKNRLARKQGQCFTANGRRSDGAFTVGNDHEKTAALY